MPAHMREEEPGRSGFGSQFEVLHAPLLLVGHHFAQVSETATKTALILSIPSTSTYLMSYVERMLPSLSFH